MFKFENINFSKDKEKILEKVYSDILHTYEKYFKKYGTKRWEKEKFYRKIKRTYPLGIYEKDTKIYMALSYPLIYKDGEYSKIGFWTFDKNVFKNRNLKRSILSNCLRFLEDELIKRYKKPKLFLEIPYDFDPVKRFYEEQNFTRCKDKTKISHLLNQLNMEIEEWDEEKYRTKGSKVYHQFYEKSI